jgi:hypothetical protein
METQCVFCDSAYYGESQPTFQKNIFLPFSWSKSRVLLAACLMLVCCLAYSLILKIEATCYCETSVDFDKTTSYYMAEDIILHSHCRENIKVYLFRLSATRVIAGESENCFWKPSHQYPYCESLHCCGFKNNLKPLPLTHSPPSLMQLKTFHNLSLI